MTNAFDSWLQTRHEEAPRGSLPEDYTLAGWRVVAFLNRGSSAEVYKVQDDEGHYAALKLFAPLPNSSVPQENLRQRFANEVTLLTAGGTALPKVFTTGTTPDGRDFIVMELFTPFELPHDDHAVAKFIRTLCRSLASLHASGKIHRDLKPANIMCRANGEPVIIDYGLATAMRAAPPPDQAHALSVVGSCAIGVGTRPYAAPEQFDGNGALNAASDVHALGVIIEECFGGKVPSAWYAIVNRATSSRAARRYQSVNALARVVALRHTASVLYCLAAIVIAALAVKTFLLPAAPANSRDDLLQQRRASRRNLKEFHRLNSLLDQEVLQAIIEENDRLIRENARLKRSSRSTPPAHSIYKP